MCDSEQGALDAFFNFQGTLPERYLHYADAGTDSDLGNYKDQHKNDPRPKPSAECEAIQKEFLGIPKAPQLPADKEEERCRLFRRIAGMLGLWATIEWFSTACPGLTLPKEVEDK